MSELLQVAATLEKVESRLNRTLWMKIVSQEGCSDEVIARFAGMVGKLGWLVFLPERRIDIEQVSNLPEIPEDGGRSPAQRLKGVLWRQWEQGGKVGDANDHYRANMERVISAEKERLT